MFPGLVKRVSPYTIKRNGVPACEDNSTGCVCAKNDGVTNNNSTNARDLESDSINSLDVFAFCTRVLLPSYGSLFGAQWPPMTIHLDFGPLAIAEDRGFVGDQFFVFGDRFNRDNLSFPRLGVQ